MARQTPCIPAQPIYSSTSPCNRQEVSENRGREFYMGLMYTVLVLTDFFFAIYFTNPCFRVLCSNLILALRSSSIRVYLET